MPRCAAAVAALPSQSPDGASSPIGRVKGDGVASGFHPRFLYFPYPVARTRRSADTTVAVLSDVLLERISL